MSGGWASQVNGRPYALFEVSLDFQNQPTYANDVLAIRNSQSLGDPVFFPPIALIKTALVPVTAQLAQHR
jgi:hypothetical protein